MVEHMRKKCGTLIAMPDHFYRPAIANEVSDLATYVAEGVVKLAPFRRRTKSGDQIAQVVQFVIGYGNRIRKSRRPRDCNPALRRGKSKLAIGYRKISRPEPSRTRRQDCWSNPAAVRGAASAMRRSRCYRDTDSEFVEDGQNVTSRGAGRR